MAIANLIGAGIGAILPVVMEAMRDKPDPEAAKSMLRSQRQARVEEAIGAGMNMQQAEKQVDAQLEQEFKAADEAGEFNTPWGEMVAQAALGAALPWAAVKGAGMVKGAAAAGKFGKRIQGMAGPAAAGAAGATDDAAAAAAKAAAGGVDDAAMAASKAAPSPLDIQNAMSAGMPLTKGKAVVTKGGGDVAEMLAGPFPGAQAEIPLTMGKAVKPPRASNVDVMAMLGGGPFPG
jgi:hypothetical protein